LGEAGHFELPAIVHRVGLSWRRGDRLNGWSRAGATAADAICRPSDRMVTENGRRRGVQFDHAGRRYNRAFSGRKTRGAEV